MKKTAVQDKLAQAGNTIHNLNASAWNTAMNPDRHGWGRSLFSVATLPVLGVASLGHLVSTAVVKQIPDGAFEKIPSGRDDGR